MPKTPAKTKAAPKPTRKYLTWEHPKGSGIKIAEMPNKTGGDIYGTSFQVRIPAKLLGRPGQREFHQRPTKAEAQRIAEERFIALTKHGTEFSRIPLPAQRSAAVAWGMLNEHGIDFIEAAAAAIRHLRPAGGLRTVAQVVDELVLSKLERAKAGGLDPRSQYDFKNRGERVKEALGSMLINQVRSEDITKWLVDFRKHGQGKSGDKVKLRTVLNYRSCIAEVFTYAKAKRYCAENPMENFTKEDYKGLGGERGERDLDSINVLTIEETRRLLNAAFEDKQSGFLPSVILRLFCGIRTREVCRLDWSEVHWLDPKPYVHIPEGKAKKRRIRHVDIPENALAWLKLCNPPKAGAVAPGEGDDKRYTNRFNRIVKLAGIGKTDGKGRWVSDWESNDTRHSYGTYHYALYGDSIKTAKQMGHKQNDEVLFAHYRSLVKKEQAEEYFGIKPTTEAEKVERFPQAAKG